MPSFISNLKKQISEFSKLSFFDEKNTFNRKFIIQWEKPLEIAKALTTWTHLSRWSAKFQVGNKQKIVKLIKIQTDTVVQNYIIQKSII